MANASVVTPSWSTFLDQLRTATEAARSAVDANEAAVVEHQKAQAEARELGIIAHRHLCALRRLLRLELGTIHHDYQRLRTPRRNAAETEAEGVANDELVNERRANDTEPEETALPFMTSAPPVAMNGAHA